MNYQRLKKSKTELNAMRRTKCQITDRAISLFPKFNKEMFSQSVWLCMKSIVIFDKSDWEKQLQKDDEKFKALALAIMKVDALNPLSLANRDILFGVLSEMAC